MFLLMPLMGQNVPLERLVETKLAPPEYTLIDMAVTPVQTPYSFFTKAFSYNSFSLEPSRDFEKTDASMIFKDRFQHQKWESTLFDATLVTHALLNVADYFSTREALKYPGLREGNPLMQPFVKNDLAFAAVKIGLTTGNHFLLKNIYKKNKTLGWVVSITSNLLLSYVVAHNMELINQAGNRQ